MAISDPGSYPRSVELRYCPVNRVDETYMGAAENLSRGRSSERAAGVLSGASRLTSFQTRRRSAS